jgi:hypothetical protein
VSGLLHDIANAYDREILVPGKQPQLILLGTFLITFGIVRGITHAIRSQRISWLKNVEMGTTHVHHMVWGILLLLVTGYVAIALELPVRDILAVAFGIGAALTLDEFALWLNLEDDYWTSKGRRSIDAVIVAAVLGGLVLVGVHFWVEVAQGVEFVVDAVVGAFGLLGLALAVVCLLKGKLVAAVLSIFFPPVGAIAALRLARPRSWWGRRYGEHKLLRSERRFGLARVP